MTDQIGMLDAVERPGTSPISEQPLRLLLVEDNPGDARLVEEAFRQQSSQPEADWQYEIVVVERLKPAIKVVRAEEFDLVLLDLGLPDSQGMETVRQVRAADAHVPIVVLTGNVDQETAMRALRAGAEDYLVKGEFDPELLTRAVRYSLERSRLAKVVEKGAAVNKRILSSLSAHIAVLNNDGVIVRTNLAWEQFSRSNGGKPENTGVGTNYIEIVSQAAAEGVPGAKAAEACIRAVIHGDSVFEQLEYPCHSPTEKRWFTMRVTPFKEAGQMGTVIAHEDITEVRQAEIQLEERRRELSTILENTPDIIARFDLEGRHLYISPSIERYSGHPPAHYIGKTDAELGLPPERVERGRRVLQQVTETGQPVQVEYEVARDADIGSAGHVFQTVVVPEFDIDDEIQSLLMVARDITELKESHQLAKYRARVLEAVSFTAHKLLVSTEWQESIPTVLTRLGEAVEVHRACIWRNEQGPDGQLLASQFAEWTSIPELSLENAEDLQAVSYELGFSRWSDLLSRGKSVQGPISSFLESEQELLAEQGIQSLAAVPIFAEGNWWGFLGFADAEVARNWDPPIIGSLHAAAASIGSAISRKQWFDELEQREQQYRLLAENSIDVIWQMDKRLNFTYISPSVEELFGYTPEEYVGTNLSDHTEWKQYFRLAKQALAGIHHYPNVKTVLLETELLHKDGHSIQVEIAAGISADGSGNLVGIQGTTRDIRERKRAEQKLRDSERRLERERDLFEMLTETSPVAITLLNKEGNITFANNEAEAVLELSKSAITDREYNNPAWRIEDFEGHPFPEDELPFVQAMVRAEPVYDVRHAIVTPDGRRKLLSINAAPVIDDEGEVNAVVANILDITHQVEAERKLQASEERYRMLFNTINDGIVVVDADRKLTQVNPSFAAMFGYEPHEMIGRTSEFLYATEEVFRAVGEKALRAHEQGDGNISYNGIRLITKDGQEFIGEIQADTLRDDEGNRIGNVGVFRDVTERIKTQEALRASEQRYRSLFDSIYEAIIVADPEGIIRNTNPAFTEIFGYEQVAVIGEPISILMAPDEDFVGIEQSVTSDLAQAEITSQSRRIRYMRKSGQIFPGEARIFHLRNPEGELIGRVGLIKDITEQEKARQALEASEERFRSLFNSIRDAILVADQDRCIIQCNPAFTEVFGYQQEEIIGKPTSLIYKDPAEFDRLGKKIRELQEIGEARKTVTVQYRRKDGEVFPGETGIYSLTIESGKTVGAIGLIRDVTERVRRQREQEAIAQVAEALRQASRREEMPPIILEELLDLLDAGGAEMGLTNKQQDRLWVELGVGSWEQFTGLEVDPENFGWQILHSDEAFQTDDLHTVPGFTSANSIEKDRAAIAVGMKAGDVPIGTLWAAREMPFDSDDIQLLRSIADMAGNALQRAGLHEETQKRAEQLSAVSLLGQDLAEKLDEFAIYERLTKGTMRLLPGISSVFISRYDPEQDHLFYVYGQSEGEMVNVGDIETLALSKRPDSSQARVVHDRRPLVQSNLQAGDDSGGQYSRTVEGSSTASALFVPMIGDGRVIGIIQAESYFSDRFTEMDGEMMSLAANSAAVALENAELLRETQGSAIELAMAYDTTLEGWAKALELRDKETEGHTRRVTDMTVRLASRLDVPAEDIVQVRRGALMHDIGKMGIPDSILLKPGKLTEDEWEIMRRHPQMAYNMLERVDFLRPALTIPLYHHERWNGSGYPEGLQGEDIPLEARIFAVIDVYDALSSDRPYREAWPREKVHNYLRENAGVEFDPKVVEAFFEIIESD